MIPGCRIRPDGGCDFVVWAPGKERVELLFPGDKGRAAVLDRDAGGYWHTCVSGTAGGEDYLYRLDGAIVRPDPASHFQPAGVHGASRIVDHGQFTWRDDDWPGIALRDFIVYELHVGTFTAEGTFDAASARLAELVELGVTALEIMPVAQFPGGRNWGYDGVYPYAVQSTYGGPAGLKRLVDSCHRHGLAVILDVVYNHLGPEGNYLRDFGPYFTDRYRTPWGEAVNFDGPGSDGVRDYFLGNARHWFESFHIDALRIDAVHAIYDLTARPFLQELAESAAHMSAALGRPCLLIGENDRNDPRMTRKASAGGWGIDAGWNDDFHHALRTLITGDRQGYYADFGSTDQFAKAWREGFVYTGEYSPYRERRHGAPSGDLPSERFVVFSQNHDQVGNSMLGERLSVLVDFESLKLTAAAVMLSPYPPLLFMGEEYGEEAPFLYFISHGDPDLVAAVRQGRKVEFQDFQWQGEPPDPQDEETFRTSKLRWSGRKTARGAALRRFYTELAALRRGGYALATAGRDGLETCLACGGDVLWVCAAEGDRFVSVAFNFSDGEEETPFPFAGTWTRIIDSSATEWMGPGSLLPESAAEGVPVRLRPRSASLWLGRGRDGRT